MIRVVNIFISLLNLFLLCFHVQISFFYCIMFMREALKSCLEALYVRLRLVNRQGSLAVSFCGTFDLREDSTSVLVEIEKRRLLGRALFHTQIFIYSLVFFPSPCCAWCPQANLFWVFFFFFPVVDLHSPALFGKL